MRISAIFFVIWLIIQNNVFPQNITLQPVQGQMNCLANVKDLGRQTFALGLPETIASSEGIILNFPEVNIVWSGPDEKAAVWHNWITAGKVDYTLKIIPYDDYVDVEIRIKNISNQNWTNVFTFNCLNPVAADKFKDWTLERTYMSKSGKPFRMDGTKRVNEGQMKTVQFYLNEDYINVSPFVNGFKAVSPDKTDDSYIVTMSEDGNSYMAATSPKSNFLFDNLDRCCIHSAADFGDIARGEEKSIVCRFYFAKGNLKDFLERFNNEVKNSSKPRVAMCWANPWELADTEKWGYVLKHLDILKIYIGDVNDRIDKAKAKTLIKSLIDNDVKIAVELGGLLDWHASKGDRAAEASFQQEFTNLKPLIDMIKEFAPERSIDIIDMDGPVRRMLYPNDKKEAYHTIESAAKELFEAVKLWRDSVPGIEINLLTNFPNWAWGSTPAYFKLFGSENGYGHYEDVLNAVKSESQRTGLKFDGLTIDNPYDYATGKANSNQPAVIQRVDWMERISELADSVKAMEWKVNMIFNTNGGRTAQGYFEQSLELIDLYHQQVGIPDGYWIQSWYQLPDKWLPEDENFTMTNLTKEAIKKINGEVPQKNPALLEPEDGRVYHGVQTMTFEPGNDPLAGYLKALNEPAIQPAVRGIFFSIPGTRGPEKSLAELANFFKAADSIGFIPELSLFLVSDVATDSVIALTTKYDWIIDSIITLSKVYGKPMFLRIGGEFNGKGEGWNGGGYSPYIYVAMFRKIVDMYKARGFRDSIAVNWCYEPDAGNDFDSVDARGALWYPGDDYVDWFGLDVFDSEHFDQSLEDYDRRGITRKGKSERFLSMARAKGKPVFLSETSAKGINISVDSLDGINDWNNWFAKFWHFIDVHPEIKGFAYINANWPQSAYPNWGDARIQNSPYITLKYKEEMKKPKYIHLPQKNVELFTATPITEMGRSLYKGFGGGLYPDGTNTRPDEHNIEGLQLAKSIIPLNKDGNEDKENGRIVLLSIGMSNTSQEYAAFERILDTFKLKNPQLISVNGAQGGQTAAIIKNPNAEFWNVIEAQRLPSNNVSSKQVQVIWLKQANAGPNKAFPEHSDILKEDIKEILKILPTKYPNLKQVYLSSRIYGGYATTQLNPEPYAYESGFTVKWLIQEQIEGDTSLIYKGESRKSAWLSWGPYLWASGPNPREDRLVWLEEDFVEDGTHPSNSGRQKVARMLLNFFSTDECTVPWFLAKPTSVEESVNLDLFTLQPNPTSDYFEINLENVILSEAKYPIKIYNTFGECVMSALRQAQGTDKIKIDISHLPVGLYFIQIGNYSEKILVVR